MSEAGILKAPISRKVDLNLSTWLITGCSTGFGRALAEAVIDAGHNVVLTARDVTKVADLAETASDRTLAVALDVTDAEQITAAVHQAQERFDGVDVLVNNAGYGYRAAIEEGDDADVRALFDTHFFLAAAPEDAPTPVEDGTETARAFWASAAQVLADAEAGRAHLIFPTRRVLERLATLGSFEAAAAHAAAYPVRTITPWIERRDGVDQLCIPDDLGYPVTAEPLAKAQRR